MKRLVVFTGAGVSAESGLKTFRDSGGLWENHSIYEVATPEAWASNPELVLDFYNQRRLQMAQCEPNAAHYAIAALEKNFDVVVITQNVDDLHERAGSSMVLHLHGELKYARSTADESLLYDFSGKEIKLGDCCEKGGQLRPHVVWFGEAVPTMVEAEQIAASAEVFVVVGTSLQVYPAAGLIYRTPPHCEHFYIDPEADSAKYNMKNLTVIKEKASSGMSKLAEALESN